MDITITYKELQDLVAELENYEYIANGRLAIADKYRALLEKATPASERKVVMVPRPRVGNY